jgi:hypothetical protein
MADWSKILSRGDIEDRRGGMAFAGGGLGLLGIGIVIALNLLSGGSVDVGSILGQLPAATSQTSLNSQDFAGQDDYERFTATVLGSNNDLWHQVFTQSGRPYQEPKLVLFRTATQSSCGMATSQVGPHYCPLDGTIYIDETFYDELTSRFGAKGGDVAEAYVIAHEVGHHVQHQLGIINENEPQTNQHSVKVELQADCFAGVWAHSVAALGVFEPGEIHEALDAAAAVGDDRIQSKVQGQITPETWTHGSSAQRVKWFNQGFSGGDPSRCNTFST